MNLPRFNHALASVVTAGLLAACAGVMRQATQVPEAPVARTLEVPEFEARTKRADFAVVATTPRGPMPERSYATDDAARSGEVAITFNRAMVELGLAGDNVPDVATVRLKGGVAVTGTWRWVGTRTAAFDPRPRLPYASEFVVELKPALKALSGEVMENSSAFNFAFSTAPVRLENVRPRGNEDDGDSLTPTATFVARFTQPVDPKMVAAHTRVHVGNRVLKVRAERDPDAKSDTMRVWLRPEGRLPLDAAVTVQVDRTLRGVEGTLPSGEVGQGAFHTYRPLRATLACSGSCTPTDGFYVETNNYVNEQELRRAVRVNGKVVDWSARGAVDATARTRYFEVPTAKLVPGANYTLALVGAVHDRFGQNLGGPRTNTFRVWDYAPELQVGARSGTLEAARPRETRVVHIKSVNVPTYRIETAVVPPELYAAVGDNAEDLNERNLVWQGRDVKVREGKNHTHHEAVDLHALLAASGGRGLVLLRIPSLDPADEGTPKHFSVHRVTDLALSAKWSPFGSEVYASRLSSAAPYEGVALRLVVGENGSWESKWQGRTDASGKALVPEAARALCGDGHGCQVLAQAAGDTAALSYGSDHYTPGAPYADLSPEERLGLIYAERDLYKRGETVHAKAVLRGLGRTGSVVQPGESYTVTASMGDDKSEAPLFKKELKTGPFGDFSFEVAIPKTAPLGDLRMQVEGNGLNLGHSVSVTTYRPAAFKVAVDAHTPSVMGGDPISFLTRGSYLFGGGMNGAKAHLRATWGRSSFLPPGASEAQLLVGEHAPRDEDTDSDEDARVLQETDVELDAEGQWLLSLKAPTPKHGAPLSVALEADIEDFTRQHGGGTGSTMVHPADFYMALKEPETEVYVPGKAFHSEFAALNIDGTHRADVRARVELLRRTSSCVTENNGDMGARRRCTSKDTAVGRCDVVTRAGLVGCDLTPPSAGQYVLQALAVDAKGRRVAVSTNLYAWGDGDDAYGSDRGGEITLVADKRDYKPGDKAGIFVRMPFTESEAIVSIERAGVYHSFRTHLAGAMPRIELPIQPEMGAAANVVVELLKGRTAEGKGSELGGPEARYGHVRLPIDISAHKLSVSIEGVRKQYAPGEKVELDVQALDAMGKPASAGLTVYAVDEGVLMLSGYKRPDLLEKFVANPGQHVASRDSRDELAPLFMPYDPTTGDKGEAGGGGGEGMSASNARKDFRSTVFFAPDLVTDSRGRARVSFTLPDGLTSYRLMAVAMTKSDQYGGADASLVVSKKLMARPALPRYAYAGDLVRGGVVVTSTLERETQVVVKAFVDGALLEGGSEQTVTVKPRGSVEAVWPLRMAKLGTAKLRFEVRGGGETDNVEVALDVRAPLVPEAVSLYNETDGVVRESLASLGALRSDYGGLQMSVASGPIVGLQDALQGVWDYPYGCSEQLTTKVLSTFAAEDLKKRLGIAVPSSARAHAEEAVATVLSRQADDGGFGWYSPDYVVPDCRLSAFVTYGLHEAAKRGYAVPKQAREHAVEFLRRRCHGVDGARISESAFVQDMLVGAGAADPGTLSELYSKRMHLGLQDVAVLAHAMKGAGMGAEQLATLRAMLDSTLKPGADGTARRAKDHRFWYSDAETAHVLRAIAALDAEHPMLAPVVKLLMAEREHGSWRNTYATVWSLLALRDAAEALHLGETKLQAEAFMGKSLFLDALFEPGHAGELRATMPMSELLQQDLSRGLTVRATGGRVYTAATLRYARKDLPTKAVESGMYLEARMGTISRKEKPGEVPPRFPAPSGTSLQAGDMVAIDIEVTADEDVDNAVIVAAIPAGLEAIRTDLQVEAGSVGRAASGPSPSSYDDHEVRWYRDLPAGLHHFRVLARATTRGSYVVPPMRAESMYNPDVFGRTAGGALEVR